LRRALAVDPTRAEVAIDLERALVESHASRAEVLDEIRAIPAPEKLPADMQLTTGRVALDRGDVGLAESFLARAAQLSPSDAVALEWHGMALGMAGHTVDAISELALAVRLDPSSPTAHLDLAVTYSAQGRFADAHHEAEVALQLKPDYARARDLLAAL